MKSIARIVCLLFVVAGIAMIVVGIGFNAATLSSGYTDSVISTSFGGDFYTYSYKATRVAAINAAATAHNVITAANAVKQYAGTAFIFAGILTILSGLWKLASVKNEPAREAAPAVTAPAFAAVPETVQPAADAPAAEETADPETEKAEA